MQNVVFFISARSVPTLTDPGSPDVTYVSFPLRWAHIYADKDKASVLFRFKNVIALTFRVCESNHAFPTPV